MNTTSAEGLPELPVKFDELIREVADHANSDDDFVSQATQTAIDKLRDEIRAYGELCRRTASPAEGRHGAEDHGIERSSRATFVPCDCGCGRSCCAHCGVDVGFVTSPADSPATLGDQKFQRSSGCVRCDLDCCDGISCTADIETIADDLERLGMEDGWICASVGAQLLRTLAKKPEGRAVDGLREMDRVYNFLMGIGGIDGLGFGDKNPKVRGPYWWRTNLASAYATLRKQLHTTPPEVGGGRGD